LSFTLLPTRLMAGVPLKLKQFASLCRLRPFDTSTEGGRSKERLRRAGLTTITSMLSRGIGLLTSLVSVPLTFRYLGTERYGIWMVLISIIAAMGFADLGIGNGLMNAISEAYGKDDRKLAREYVTSALGLMLCIAAVLAVFGIVAYPFLPWMRLFNVKSSTAAADGAKAFLILYASFVVNIPLGVISRAQSGLQKGYAAQMINAFGSVLSLAAMLFIIWLHGTLAWLVSASVVAGITTTLLNGWILFRDHPWLIPTWQAFQRSSANRIFKLGLMFFVLQCVVTISFTSDNIVIAQVLGVAAVAAYAVPQKLFSLVPMVVSMGIGPLWPAYGEASARGDLPWVRKVFLNSLWLTLVITIPLCTLLVLAGPWLLKVAAGKSLDTSMSLLIVLASWAVINSVSFVISMLLNGTGTVKLHAVSAVFASVVNLGLSIVLTHRLGVMGVCLGSIISQLAITLPVCFIVIRNLFKTTENAIAAKQHLARCESLIH
jgi:O-antigen/teichoic acid export membrane protein